MPENKEPKRRPAPDGAGARRSETGVGTARHEALERRAERMPRPSQPGGAGTFGTAGLKERGGDFFGTATGLQGQVLPEREASPLPAGRRGKDKFAHFYVPPPRAAVNYLSPTRSSAAKAKQAPEMLELIESVNVGVGSKKRVPLPSTPEATD
jgi:hypothetical protein